MTLYKFAEIGQVLESDIESPEKVLADPELESRIKSLATGLKRIAPKGDDFLYFSAVMMHAAEASTVDPEGKPKKTASGLPVTAGWATNGESLRWVSNDPSVMPYKNSNGDIFPEEELLKAYKKWVGCPLCIDHKSGSVDHIRGVIIDTYYDRKAKRVIALCALDKVSFPELARKVSTGYATCVSMGTAVGRAICSDCGRVARTEADFCSHMTSKSCYGEINLDLKPLELSIVVNGADPQAKIRHILASARTLNSQADAGLSELKSLTGTSSEKVNEIKQQIVSHIKEGLDTLIREFDGRDEGEVQDSSNFSNSGSSIVDATQVPLDQDPAALNNPYALRVASTNSENNDALKNQFLSLKRDIEHKLAKIEEDFRKLSNLGDGSRETTMEKKSYFQGAGGVNEPSPGTPKYEKDPLNEKLRTHGDKQMEGQMDTGPVEGMHPGPQSAGESEEARKKRLLRAELDQRSTRRKEAIARVKETLEKRRAYFQGAGGVNEPTPGKEKYDVDPLNEKTRMKGDKQMEGQPPFPGVGSTTGLHPSPSSADPKDELKRKELLQRATLRAKFIKAAKPSTGEVDLGASQWQIFADDKLVFAATVNELSSGRADVLGESIATKEFGASMLKKVKADGFESAIAMFKKAEPPVAPAGGGMDAAPMGAAGPAPSPAGEMGGAPMGDLATADKGGDGKAGPEQMVEKLDEAITNLSDVKEELSNTIPTMEGEAPMAPGEGMPAATATLSRMRFDIHKTLLSSMRKTADLVQNQIDELHLVKDLYDNKAVTEENRSYIDTLSTDTISDANHVLADATECLDGFVRYARGTESLEAVASLEARGDDEGNPAEQQILAELKELVNLEEGEHKEHAMAAASDSNNGNTVAVTKDQLGSLPQAPADTKFELKNTATFDLTTREGRTAYRAKLATESIKWNPMLAEFHKYTDDTTQLDVKPEGDLGKIEKIEEIHSKMMDVAEAPPKVRKDAEEILKMVKAGAITHEEVPNLVAHGADPAAVAYYMQMWKPVDGGSEFAKGLVKEHAKAAAEKEISDYKVKVARAYDMAYQMADRGMCGTEPSVLAAQVEEILSYNDESFNSLKRIVAMAPSRAIKKEASRVPMIGMIGSGDPISAQLPSGEPDDLYSSLTKAFAGRKY
jgi:hypothetical protein